MFMLREPADRPSSMVLITSPSYSDFFCQAPDGLAKHPLDTMIVSKQDLVNARKHVTYTR